MTTTSKHELELADLQKWLITAKMLYASDGNGKKLYVNSMGGFDIEVNGEIVWQGIQPYLAIEKYNEI